MADIQNQIARLEQELATLKQLVNKPKEKWRPKPLLGSKFPIDIAVCTQAEFMDYGMYYEDRPSAEKATKDLILYTRMRKFAHERNGNWIPDWTNRDQPKFVVIQKMPTNNYQVQQTYYFRSPSEIYFKNHADAQELADLLNNDQF